MPEQFNLALREHVTSIGFSMTLSKRMIDTLVALHHFKGNFHELVQWQYCKDDKDRLVRRAMFGHYVTSYHALVNRGLVTTYERYNDDGTRDVKASRHNLTKAGHLIVALLKEAGIYQERMKEIGLQ